MSAENAASIVPVKMERLEGARIAIEWSDGRRDEFAPTQLRKACPCATCREKRKAAEDASASKPTGLLPVLRPEEAQPLEIAAMRPAGQYAYNIQFNDGHQSGLFTFDHLRELGQGH